jgi:predicted ester cyclase
MLLAGFPDLRIDVHTRIGEADTVVARLTVSGTNLGDYRGLPEPTNQHFETETETEVVAIFRLADGNVAEIHGTADRLGMLVPLGIVPDIG